MYNRTLSNQLSVTRQVNFIYTLDKLTHKRIVLTGQLLNH